MPDAHRWLAGQGAARGLEVEEDGDGNTVLWWGEGGDAVLTGALTGAYDGPPGAVQALAAVDLLREEGFEPARPIGVAALADAAAAARAGWAARVGCFVEPHVEQDRDLGVPVAVGWAVAAHGRWRLTFDGTDGHDPVLTFAMTALAANKQARLSGQRAVVGRVEVLPSAADAVATRVTAWLDARATDDDALARLVGDVTRQAEQRADRDGTTLTVVEESVAAAVALDADLVRRLTALLDAPAVPAWAGRDAGALQAAGIPSALILVRDPTVVAVLGRVLRELAS